MTRLRFQWNFLSAVPRPAAECLLLYKWHNLQKLDMWTKLLPPMVPLVCHAQAPSCRGMPTTPVKMVFPCSWT
eukprot:32363_6